MRTSAARAFSVQPTVEFDNKIKPFLDLSSTPIIKWVGGKGRLLSQLAMRLPAGADTMRHIEPFAGGAAFFFARRPRAALVCDVNPDLIRMYEAVRENVEDVIKALEPLQANHNEETYYQVREAYNLMRRKERFDTAEHAAFFIYLNKTCFNGLYRVNKKGGFNVPMGRYTNPTILDASNLRKASETLATTELKHQSFTDLVDHTRSGDFVYFDPPYEPISTTACFTEYAKSGFTQLDQARLRDVFVALHKKGCSVMLSNSDTPLIRHLYKGFRIEEVSAPRMVSCQPGSRKPVIELVIRNY